MWTNKDEVELLNALDKLNKKGVKFALSNVLIHKGNENKLLKEWLDKNNFNIYPIKSRYISYHDNNNDKTIEVLVTNYE